MKTFRYITPKLSIDITMPSWLFFFFKRFASIKSTQPFQSLQGLEIGTIIYDEGLGYKP